MPITTDNIGVAKKVASMLLDIEAIKLNQQNPFTWASGWKSPIYCDNRLSLSFPQVRSFIKDELVQSIRKNHPEAEIIAGVATAGIPQAALVADAMNLPLVYVRSKPKGHGMENLIEGQARKGQKAVVIEDLISTGGSSIKAAKALQEAGVEVLGMQAIFTYGFDISTNNFQDAGITLSCLSEYEVMLEEALEKHYISKDQVASLQEWRMAPDKWGV